MISWIIVGLIVFLLGEQLDYSYQRDRYNNLIDYIATNWETMDVIPLTILVLCWPVHLFLIAAKFMNKER